MLLSFLKCLLCYWTTGGGAWEWEDRKADCNVIDEKITTPKNLVNFGQGTLIAMATNFVARYGDNA